MRDDLGVTEVKRNVGHYGFSPETRLCYLQKGLLSLHIISGHIQESTKGEKRDLRICDRNAEKESFRFTPHVHLFHRELDFQY